MTDKQKKKLIETLKLVQKENDWETVAETLMENKETRSDYDLSLILARAFLELSGDEKKFAEAAEILLNNFYEDGYNDPKWNYLIAYSLYLQGRPIECVRHLMSYFDKEKDNEPENPEDREYYDNAYELFTINKKELEENVIEYTEKERKIAQDHIEKHFGQIGSILHENCPLGVAVDIAVIPPDENRNYLTLATIGMGANYMQLPDELKGSGLGRVELIVYLPPDHELTNEDWAIRQLTAISHLPIERNTWVGYGHIFSNGVTLTPDTTMDTTMLIQVQDCDDQAFCFSLPKKSNVFFYQIMPLYPEETKFKLRYGTEKLIERMADVSAVADVHRENVCKDWIEKDDTAIVGEEIELFSDPTVGENCAVSRRVLIDGCKVGYMRRIYFDPLDENNPNDSGWLILAGDETPEYMSEPFNLAISSLNTVCNIDNEIIPFLSLPFGSVVRRNLYGKLEQEITPNNIDDSPLFS